MEPQQNTGTGSSGPPSGGQTGGRSPRPRPQGIAGVTLILIGVLALIATLSKNEEVGLLFLPALGLIFLIWGIAVRNAGPLIPGGILTGLGVGVLLSQQVLNTPDDQSAAIILISMGAGFLIITPLAWVVTQRRLYWPIIPAAVLVVIGVAILVGGTALQVVQVVGMFWPVLLIAGGVYVLWRAGFRRPSKD